MKKLLFPLIFILSVMPVHAYESKGLLKINADKMATYDAKDFTRISKSLSDIEAYNDVLAQAYTGHSDVISADVDTYIGNPSKTTVNIEVKQSDGTVLAKLNASDIKNMSTYVDKTMTNKVKSLVQNAEADRKNALKLIRKMQGVDTMYNDNIDFDVICREVITAGLAGSAGTVNGKGYQIKSLDYVQTIEEGIRYRYVVTSEAVANRNIPKIPSPVNTWTQPNRVNIKETADQRLTISSFGNILMDTNGSNLVYNWSGVIRNGKLVYGTSDITEDKAKWVSGSEIFFRSLDVKDTKERILAQCSIFDETETRKEACYKKIVKILNSRGVEVKNYNSVDDIFDEWVAHNDVFYMGVPVSTEYYDVTHEYSGDLLTAFTIEFKEVSP